jgi:hypothetical protein
METEELIWERGCPKCGKNIRYKTIVSFGVAKRKGSKCRQCGGLCGKSSSPEARLKMSLAYQGKNNPFFGKKHTDKTKNRIGVANTGRTWTDDARKQKSKRSMGSRNSFWGKKHTAETIMKIQRGDHSYQQTDEYRQAISNATSGAKNGMFGRKVYDIWLEKYGKEEADRRRKERADKASVRWSGAGNPMYGKPAPMGSGCGWKGWHKGWFFRSLKELSYMINIIEKEGHRWKSAETHDLSICFTDWTGHERTYRADFLLDDKKLVEVKPRKLMNTPTNLAKRKAAEVFCVNHGYEYVVEESEPLSGEEIVRLWREKLIVFQGRYDKLFRERYAI